MSRALSTTEWCRAAARRISRGSGRLVTLIAWRIVHAGGQCWERVTGWVSSASGIAWVLRIAVLVVPPYLLRHQALDAAGGVVRRAEAGRWLLWPMAIVWVITAYRIGHPDWTPKTNAPADDGAEPEQEEAQQDSEAEQTTVTPEAPLLSPLDVCEAVWRVGTPHAHLAVLAEELDTTTDRVREVLAVKGIPIEPVRMKGRGSSTGVKASHFPTPAAPSGDVVAAGQATNNNDNNVRVEHHAGGAHITVTPARQDTRAA